MYARRKRGKGRKRDISIWRAKGGISLLKKAEVCLEKGVIFFTYEKGGGGYWSAL